MSKPKEVTSEIALKVREVRKLTGLNQEEFCKKYHIPISTLRNWEQGFRECPMYVVELLEFRIKNEYGTERDV